MAPWLCGTRLCAQLQPAQHSSTPHLSILHPSGMLSSVLKVDQRWFNSPAPSTDTKQLCIK